MIEQSIDKHQYCSIERYLGSLLVIKQEQAGWQVKQKCS